MSFQLSPSLFLTSFNAYWSETDQHSRQVICRGDLNARLDFAQELRDVFLDTPSPQRDADSETPADLEATRPHPPHPFTIYPAPLRPSKPQPITWLKWLPLYRRCVLNQYLDKVQIYRKDRRHWRCALVRAQKSFQDACEEYELQMRAWEMNRRFIQEGVYRAQSLQRKEANQSPQKRADHLKTALEQLHWPTPVHLLFTLDAKAARLRMHVVLPALKSDIFSRLDAEAKTSLYTRYVYGCVTRLAGYTFNQLADIQTLDIYLQAPDARFSAPPCLLQVNLLRDAYEHGFARLLAHKNPQTFIEEFLLMRHLGDEGMLLPFPLTPAS
ncbi:hypothetical protein [Nitrincola tapanii]|uniref:Uncharacterized protein n=1 Tax=Nitrincola tapanii TaxID=1708751 RepID=A0A5A9W7J8_9GAMM|nr:hypothetical protein [Nitrincola tapanii]KAA0875431.1 hypothetical protein E1H14_05445 [Nitrincola tapanii]